MYDKEREKKSRKIKRMFVTPLPFNITNYKQRGKKRKFFIYLFLFFETKECVEQEMSICKYHQHLQWECLLPWH